MESDIDDSVFDFFDDSPKRKYETFNYVEHRDKIFSLNDPVNIGTTKTGQSSFETNKHLQTKSGTSGTEEEFTPCPNLSEGPGSVSYSPDYEYEDDFESVSSKGKSEPKTPDLRDVNFTNISLESSVGTDDSEFNERQVKTIRNEHRKSPAGNTNAFSSREKSISEKYHISGVDVGRRREASRRQGERAVGKVPTVKTTKTSVDSCCVSSVQGSRNAGQSGSSYPDPSLKYFDNFGEYVDSGLTYDTSCEEALLHNDRFSGRFPTSGSSLNNTKQMSHRTKVSLPKLDKTGRVQLTKNKRGNDKKTTSPKVVLRQQRTHASMARKEISKPTASGSRRHIKKPPVPIPLKSEAIYCNGELSVNVRGDPRGNLDKNKFNVTITVVHKQMKSFPTPYKSCQPPPCRRRWRNDDLDLDIVHHRAMFPGFNTSTDPEVNRRYLQQFGL